MAQAWGQGAEKLSFQVARFCEIRSQLRECRLLDLISLRLPVARVVPTGWEHTFGVHPIEVNPHAFWQNERRGIPWLEGEQLEQFRAQLDEVFWSTLPAINGVVYACHKLVDSGYELIAVTAIDSIWLHARLRNLHLHSFQILQVIATGRPTPGQSNPEAQVINQMKHAVFVSGYPPPLEDIHTEVH